jgi:lysophospholipase L1-like esterase
MRSLRLLAAVGCVVVACGAGAGGAAAQSWSALGDSFTAGPLIPNQLLNPIGCLRSDRNYPHQAAARLGYSLADASCSGAETDDMTAPQSTSAGTNPPQFNALTASTNVVTVQIGGNDIGFSDILETCVTANPFNGCRSDFVHGGVDEISQAIAATAPRIDAVLQGTRARSPQARVFVVNYAAILPDTGSLGCWPQVPLAFADVPYLRAKEKELNAMLAQRAAANGAAVVDWYTASIGHDACKGRSTRWVEPLVPGNAAAPFHPNRNGMTGAANLLVAQVGG